MTVSANATLAELRDDLAAGRLTSEALTRFYLERIATVDAKLFSVRELNPEALDLARASDARRKRRPLEGLPILLKDNIATRDKQHLTAGSLALEGAQARRDATVTALLRRAGAVVLGKANLTEFANILAVGMPSGYSSLGGQVRNPYATELDANGIPLVMPGGSSAGSAVAVAAGLCAASIGTETSGSLLSPANMNGLVTVKPTVGLVSRAGILPIAASQDTAGPMTRTVLDSALLLNVLAAADADDPATARLRRAPDYTADLRADGLRGMRIGIPSDPDDPGNDVYFGPLPPRAKALMAQVITALADCGAVPVVANMPTAGWIGGPGTEMAVLNRNPLSPARHSVARVSTVFLYELKHDLNAFLADWMRGTSMRDMADIIAFNAANPERALRFGQDLFLAAEATSGTLKDLEYRAARRSDLRAARALGLDTYFRTHKLDAVLFPGNAGAAIAAKAGYPSVQVPAGFIGADTTPDYPMGATFCGPAWSEADLLRMAFAFEQATQARRPPAI